jgi:phosphoribosylformimino-5-aminoimidazole carboxamide ribotide isomerase
MVLKMGADRAIIGTKAIESLDYFNELYELSGGKTIISLDFGKDCSVFKEAWLSSSSLNLFDFGKKIKSSGLDEIIITDISRDGTLKGINIDIIKNFIEKTGLNVYVAGGISDIKDIRKLKEIEEIGIKGAIIGKALYEGRIDLSEAIKIAES